MLVKKGMEERGEGALKILEINFYCDFYFLLFPAAANSSSSSCSSYTEQGL